MATARIACLYFSDAVLRTSDRCRVDSSRRHSGDGELAVVSSRRARLRALVNRDTVGAHQRPLASDPEVFCRPSRLGSRSTACSPGHFLGATLGQQELCAMVCCRRLVTCDGEYVGVGLVVAAITYVSLIVGELVPKQIALRRNGAAVTWPPRWTLLAKVASPAVWLDVSGRLVLRALGYGRQVEQQSHRSGDQDPHCGGRNRGGCHRTERARNDRRGSCDGNSPVRAVMTPRRDVDIGRFIGRSSDDPAHTARERTFTAARSRRCARRTCWACSAIARSIFAR